MAQPSQNTSPELQARWLGLRQQHEKQNINFQAQVAKDTAGFDDAVAAKRATFEGNVKTQRGHLQDRIEHARKELLDAQIRAEQAFWSKHTQAPRAANVAAPNPKMRTAATSRPMSSVPAARQAPAQRSSGKAAPRPTQKNTVSEFIDLCSDEEEKAPLPPRHAPQPSKGPQDSSSYPIPSASIELFGGSSRKSFATPEQPLFKREESPLATPKPSSSFKTPFVPAPNLPTSPVVQRSTTVRSSRLDYATSSPTPTISSTSFMQRSMTAIPVTHPTKTSSLSKSSASTLSATNRDASSSEARPSGLASTFSFANQSPTAPPSGFKQPLFQDKRAELSLSGLRNQQRDRSSILKKPATLPRNETLFALEQQRKNGAFVNDVLQNGRSRTLAPELRDVLGENGRDVDMTGTSTAEVLQTENSTMEQEASRCVPETPKSIKPGREQLPSPPPSQASFATRVFTPLAAFKKPSTPASAGFTTASYHTVNPVSRVNRAGSVESRATSFTFPGSPQHERETPVTPDTSAITRKRGRSINPGSDDESDWATSEPDSPLANKSGKDLKVNLGIKGARMHGGGHSKQPASPAAKPKMGFKAIKSAPKSPSSPGVKSTPTTPKTPSKPSTNRFGASATSESPSARAASARPVLSKAKASPKPAPKKQKLASPPLSKRRAAIAAHNAVQQIYREEEETRTEFAIAAANAMEDAQPVNDYQLRSSMRTLSITPAPGESVRDLIEDVVDDEDKHDDGNAADTESNANREGEVYSRSAWLRDRAQGDRNVAKFQATVADEEDEELDISEYIMHDGIICDRSQK